MAFISPFPSSSSVPGDGHLVVQLFPQGTSALSTITFQYPLKLISPSPIATQKSALVFLLTYGGGLVGGDQIQLRIDIRPDARLSIVTQGHTKVFKSPSQDVVTRQHLLVTVETGGAVCLLPDPIQPFEGSVYEQSQIFTVAEGGSLCLLDWVSAGRTARGENWDFHKWSGCNEVWTEHPSGFKKRLLLRDNILLDGESRNTQEGFLKMKMQGLGLFGTLILKGSLVASLAAFFLREFAALHRIGAQDFRSQEKIVRDRGLMVSLEQAWRLERLEKEKEDCLIWSAANVRGCTVVKFGARTVEGARTWIWTMIKQEGSILQQFGEDSTMCIR